MSNNRVKPAPEKHPEPNTLLRHTYISGVATVMAHPFRIALNCAPRHQSAKETINEAKPLMFKGVSNNLIRGTLAASLQSYTKAEAQIHAGLLAGIAASAVTGTTIATLVETRLIRKVEIARLKLPANTASVWRFCLPLTSLYCIREIGFTAAVLTTGDLTPVDQIKALVAASLATAVTHKFAVIEATRDLIPKNLSVPDFRQGIYHTLRSMAHGNVYTHPAFAVHFKNPGNIWQKTGNLLHVSCGANMFLFRLLYLSAFKGAYLLAKNTPTTLSGWSGLFNAKNENALTNQPAAVIDTSTPKRKN